MPDQRNTPSQTLVPSYHVLGIPVHCLRISEVISQIESWIAARETTRYIAITGMHGVSESRRDAHFRKILQSAALVIPDGMPLVWLGRWHKHSIDRRVCGSELLEAFCEQTRSRYRHFFYGGAPGVAEDLAKRLQQRHQIRVAGTYCPPYRQLNAQEEVEIASVLEAATPDILWIGLSTPKQEHWMYEHREKLLVPAMLGVGAAFDFNSGRLRRAPSWIGDRGLEWLFRLLMEPARLWKRYLITIPSAMWSVSLELFHLRKFE